MHFTIQMMYPYSYSRGQSIPDLCTKIIIIICLNSCCDSLFSLNTLHPFRIVMGLYSSPRRADRIDIPKALDILLADARLDC